MSCFRSLHTTFFFSPKKNERMSCNHANCHFPSSRTRADNKRNRKFGMHSRPKNVIDLAMPTTGAVDINLFWWAFISWIMENTATSFLFKTSQANSFCLFWNHLKECGVTIVILIPKACGKGSNAAIADTRCFASSGSAACPKQSLLACKTITFLHAKHCFAPWNNDFQGS